MYQKQPGNGKWGAHRRLYKRHNAQKKKNQRKKKEANTDKHAIWKARANATYAWVFYKVPQISILKYHKKFSLLSYVVKRVPQQIP